MSKSSMSQNNFIEPLIAKVITSKNLSDTVKKQVLEEIINETTPNQSSNTLSECINQINDEGYTLLCSACRYKKNELVIRWLIEQNADIELGNPLVISAQNNNTPAMQILLENGAKINATPEVLPKPNQPIHCRQAAIFHAIRYGQVKAVQLLAAWGALETTSAQTMLTPLDYARKLLHAIQDYRETEEKSELLGHPKSTGREHIPKAEKIIETIAVLKTATVDCNLKAKPNEETTEIN